MKKTKRNTENDIVEIFAGSAIEAEMFKSLLEDSEIQAFLKDEIMGTLAPWYAAAGGVGSVKVHILNSDYTKAKLILEEFQRNLQ